MLCKYIPTVNILLAPVLPLLKQSKHWGKHIKQTRRKDLHTLADFYDVRERHPSLPNPAYLIPTVLSNAFLLIYMTWRRRKFPVFLPLLSVDLTYVSFIGAGSFLFVFSFFFYAPLSIYMTKGLVLYRLCALSQQRLVLPSSSLHMHTKARV